MRFPVLCESPVSARDTIGECGRGRSLGMAYAALAYGGPAIRMLIAGMAAHDAATEMGPAAVGTRRSATAAIAASRGASWSDGRLVSRATMGQ